VQAVQPGGHLRGKEEGRDRQRASHQD
jgi:hypothetical protein